MKMTLNEEIEYLQSGNWYDKVRAVLPADEYLKLGWAIGDILETLGLFRSLAPEPQTNADRIRAMDDEQLAKLFYSVYKRSCIDFVNQSGIKAEIEFKNSEASEAAFLKHLQLPAVEDIPHEYKNCLYHTVSFNGCTPDHDCTNPDGGCSNNYDRWQWRGQKED